jgi:hypothetical protein
MIDRDSAVEDSEACRGGRTTMAKKPSAKSTRKPARAAAKAAPRAKRSAPAASKAAAGKAKPKYAQAGAPWWKQFLPG